jgi:hypothetical protein
MNLKKFTYLISALAFISFSSCKKDSSSTNTTPTPTTTAITIDSPIQLSCKINGTQLSYIEDGTTNQSGWSSDNSLAGLPDTSYFAYGGDLLRSADDSVLFQIYKGTLANVGVPPSDATFDNFFANGTYGYAPNSNQKFQGVYIHIRYNNKLYTTLNNASGAQSGSNFKIEAGKQVTNPSDHEWKIKASFNCKLYDDTGASITLTDGILVCSFAKI